MMQLQCLASRSGAQRCLLFSFAVGIVCMLSFVLQRSNVRACSAAPRSASAADNDGTTRPAPAARQWTSLPVSVPPSCGAHYEFWRPHIDHSLRYHRPRSVHAVDIVGIPFTNMTIPIVFQLLHGDVFFRPLPNGYGSVQGRVSATVWQVSHAVQDLNRLLRTETRNASLPNVMFRLSADDSPQLRITADVPSEVAHEVQAPVLCTCGNMYETACTPVPDWTTAYWDNNGVAEEKGMDYDVLMRGILDRAQQRPYTTRAAKAVTRGDMRHWDRVLVQTAFAQLAPELLDVGVNTTTLEARLSKMIAQGASPTEVAVERRNGLRALMSVATNLGLPLQCRDFSLFKVQLYVAGNGYSARLKYLLATGSPVVYLASTRRGAMQEYFTPALLPWVHYIPVYSGPTMVSTVQWLLENPVEAERIGAAGQEFVQRYLMRPALTCWWASFFALYAERLAVDQVELRHRMPLSFHVNAMPAGEGSNDPLRAAMRDIHDTAIRVVNAFVDPVISATRPAGAAATEADFAILRAQEPYTRLRTAVASIGLGVAPLHPLLSPSALLSALSEFAPLAQRRDACDERMTPILHIPVHWFTEHGGNASSMALAVAGADVKLQRGARVLEWLLRCQAAGRIHRG